MKNSARGAGKPSGPDKRGFYIVLAIAAIAGIAVLSWVATRSGRVTQMADIQPIPNQGHVIGSEDAPVEVVEFGDFECAACGIFANLTEPDVRARLVNTGMIRFRFIDFPLDMHPNTRTAHMAAWCAGDQGKFWEMHDVIFMNQDRWNTQATRRPESVLENLAQQVGLDMGQYDSCMDSRKFAPQIQANYEEAVKRGIQSTPTFEIGSRRIPGTVNYDQFKQYVDEAIAAAPRRPAPRPDSLRLDTPGETARPQ